MEMRRSLIIFLLPLLFYSCLKQETLNKPSNDFESLMGKDLPEWKYVRTEEDFANLEFFKDVYEKNISYLSQLSKKEKIPKVIHYVWLGPKPFPRESIDYVRSWIAYHPDWIFKFWTDRKRPLPHPKMQLHLVKDFFFLKSEKFFHDSDNFGEKSDLLRNEILYQEGGVYVDHDVKCFRAFDSLNHAFDFYCGMEVPYPTALSSSILPTNNLLGSKPKHPILLEMMSWLAANWEEIGRNYPGNDRDAIINRISHRTFYALGKVFKEIGNQTENIDIAFPSFYFNSPKEEWALFAQHMYEGSWFENESEFEKTTRKRLMKLSKKSNQLLLGMGILGGLNFLSLSLVFLLLWKNRRQEAQRS